MRHFKGGGPGFGKYGINADRNIFTNRNRDIRVDGGSQHESDKSNF